MVAGAILLYFIKMTTLTRTYSHFWQDKIDWNLRLEDVEDTSSRMTCCSCAGEHGVQLPEIPGG